MVESNAQGYESDEANDKTFIEDQSILDKHKAAATITDGKFHSKTIDTNCDAKISGIQDKN